MQISLFQECIRSWLKIKLTWVFQGKSYAVESKEECNTGHLENVIFKSPSNPNIIPMLLIYSIELWGSSRNTSF